MAPIDDSDFRFAHAVSLVAVEHTVAMSRSIRGAEMLKLLYRMCRTLAPADDANDDGGGDVETS